MRNNEPWKSNNLLIKFLESITTIDGFRVNDTEPFKINKYWLYERYLSFNNQYFNNLLTDNVYFFIDRTNTQSAFIKYGYSKRYMKMPFLDVPANEFFLEIHISHYYSKTEKEYCEILLHEMIHGYLTTVIKHLSEEDSLNEHDSLFEDIKNSINNKGWNIKTYQIDDYTLTLDPESDALIKNGCLVAVKLCNKEDYFVVITDLFHGSLVIGYPNIRVFKILEAETFKLIKYTSNLEEYIRSATKDIIMSNNKILPKSMSSKEIEDLIKQNKMKEITDASDLRESRNKDRWKDLFKLETMSNGEIMYCYSSKPDIIP